MFQNNSKPRTKKLREDLEKAHGLYEQWMEPDWQSSRAASTGSAPKDPKFKDRSNYKFANEYQRSVSSSGNTLKRSHSAGDLTGKGWKYKDADFSKFYAWVINGTLSDLHLVKSILFD